MGGAAGVGGVEGGIGGEGKITSSMTSLLELSSIFVATVRFTSRVVCSPMSRDTCARRHQPQPSPAAEPFDRQLRACVAPSHRTPLADSAASAASAIALASASKAADISAKIAPTAETFCVVVFRTRVTVSHREAATEPFSDRRRSTPVQRRLGVPAGTLRLPVSLALRAWRSARIRAWRRSVSCRRAGEPGAAEVGGHGGGETGLGTDGREATGGVGSD